MGKKDEPTKETPKAEETEPEKKKIDIEKRLKVLSQITEGLFWILLPHVAVVLSLLFCHVAMESYHGSPCIGFWNKAESERLI